MTIPLTFAQHSGSADYPLSMVDLKQAQMLIAHRLKGNG
jgi:hypothetical protein